MIRLTKENANRSGTTIGFPRAVECYWKLKLYEDLDDVIHINLFDLPRIKVLYHKSQGEIVKSEDFAFDFKNGKVEFFDIKSNAKFKDYGKTWARTDVELEELK